MPARFCPNCGARLGEPKRFCVECGAPLYESPAPAAPRGESRLLGIILGCIGGVGVLMILACAGLLLLTLRNGLAATPVLPTAELVVVSPTSPPPPTPDAVSGVLFYEDFSDPRESVLIAEEDEISRSAFEDGAYVIEVKDTDMLAWALTDRSYDDLAIEADVEIGSDSEIVAAGLIFHYQNNQNFYLFSVSNDGYYALELLKDDEWQTLIDWTESDAIGTLRNTLRVETKGDRITLKVNGELLESTEDDALSQGDAGLAVSSFDIGQVMIRFDNLLITRSP